LYRIFDTTLNWTSELDLLAPGNPHRHPDRPDASHEVNNIPKTALRTASEALRMLLLSPHMETNVKQYIADLVFHRYSRLREEGHDDYAAVLRDCLTSDELYPRADADYMAALRTALRAYDVGDWLAHEDLDPILLAK
jgi:hypothetical protein